MDIKTLISHVDENAGVVCAEKLYATLDDVRYLWVGGFESTLTSSECCIKLGQRRVIAAHRMKVVRIERRRFRKPVVHWRHERDVIDYDVIRHLRRCIFMGETRLNQNY